jgi:NAD(P)-dependent dehydrogenase (short-subunit alcohol dehydrogenase family)
MSESRAPDRFSVAGRVILVTGATGHLGQSIVNGLAAGGALPVIAARSSDKLAALEQALRAQQFQCEAVVLDVAKADQCQRAIAQIQERIGRLDGIVNCANQGRVGTIETSTPSDFDAACGQNLSGPFALVQAALPLLRAAAPVLAGGASIVNVASMYGHVSPDPRIYGDSGRNNPPFYGAAKAGLLQLTRYLAVHLGPDRIRVNSVSPGAFPPPSIAQTDAPFHGRLCEKTPLGRIGAADELVGPVLFLLSGAASFVTGADLKVDGGWTAW